MPSLFEDLRAAVRYLASVCDGAISNMAFDNWRLSDEERMEIFRGIDIIGDALRLHHRRVRNLQMGEEEHLRRLTLLRSPIMR